MKILLVAPPFTMVPVGLAYISAALKKAGHQVDGHIFDITTYADKLNGQYDFVVTGGLASQFNLIEEITSLAKRAKKQIIVGGGIITSEPELMSRALNADYAIVGEGEETIVELLSCLESNGDISKIDGIGYFENNKHILNKSREPIKNINALPWPDFDVFNFNSHLDSAKPSDVYYYDIFDYPREYPIISSRSCPYLCTFCYHPIGNKYRERTLDSIMDELKAVIPKYKINMVSIYDELFTCKEEKVLEFCKRFSEFTSTLSWEVKWSCQMHVAGLKEHMLDAMKAAGCFMVSYGFESYSSSILKSMKKHINPEQIHRAVHFTLDRGISIQGNFIFGDKEETMQTATETLGFWKMHTEAGIQLDFIGPYPNSAIYQHALEKGVIKDKLDFIKNHFFDVFNMTKLRPSEFMKLRMLVFKYMTKYSFYAFAFDKTKNSFNARCPHCKIVLKYNNFPIKGYLYKKIIYCRNCRKRFYLVSYLSSISDKLGVLSTISPISYKIYLRMSGLFSDIRPNMSMLLKKRMKWFYLLLKKQR